MKKQTKPTGKQASNPTSKKTASAPKQTPKEVSKIAAAKEITYEIPLEGSKECRIQFLEDLGNAMVEAMMVNRAVDCSFSETSMDIYEMMYIDLDSKIKGLTKN